MAPGESFGAASTPAVVALVEQNAGAPAPVYEGSAHATPTFVLVARAGDERGRVRAGHEAVLASIGV